MTAVDSEAIDTRIETLVLDGRSVRAGSDPDIVGRIETANVDLSLSAGAPMLELVVLDSHRTLLTSGLLSDTAVDLTLGTIPFRLVEADFDGVDALTLNFEHRLVAYCRSHKRPRKFSRGSFTRAEAIYALFREIKAMPFRFVAPDLSKKQTIKYDKKSQEEKDADREPGFPDGVKLYGKSTSTPLTAGQLRNAERVLAVCRAKGAGAKATLAAVEACIIEAPDFINNTGGDASSVGILQLLDIHLNGSTATRGGRRDIELVITMFLDVGFTGSGGAIKVAQEHPTWTAGQVAQEVQGSAHPGRYDTVKPQAQDIIAAYGGDFDGGGSSDPGTRKRYEFTRGQPGKTEDTWVAGQRLANEVRWRLFIAGKQSVYYASDPTLMKSRARYLIDPTTVGLVGHPRGPLELGGRTVVTRGRREPKPSKCEITVRADRWAAGPGTVIEIADYGPYDGRWLVEGSPDRSPFDSLTVIQLRQPQKPLKEPDTGRNSSGVRTSTAKNAVDKVYAEAGRISNLALPYGAGGHGLSWDATKRLIGGSSAAGAVPGLGAAAGASLDCSSSTSMALYAGGMMGGVGGPQVSDWFLSWGDAGEGDAMTVWVHPGSGPNGHVWIEFKEPGVKRFDTSPYGDGGRGPRLRSKPRPTAGFRARHWPSS